MGARGPPGHAGPEGLRGIPGPVVSGAGTGVGVGWDQTSLCVHTFNFSSQSGGAGPGWGRASTPGSGREQFTMFCFIPG